MKPTIYLTNPAGLKVGHGGPGKVALITILPPAWLLTISSRLVPMGCPPSISMMKRAKAGEMPLADYEAACRGLWADRARRMPPGKLLSCDAKFWLARQGTPVEEEAVEDGATLLCTCGAGAPCHRRWFAEVLHAAGWRVVLDGAELEDGKAPPLPPPPPPPGSKAPQLGLFSFSAPSQSLPASPPAPPPTPPVERPWDLFTKPDRGCSYVPWAPKWASVIANGSSRRRFAIGWDGKVGWIRFYDCEPAGSPVSVEWPPDVFQAEVTALLKQWPEPAEYAEWCARHPELMPDPPPSRSLPASPPDPVEPSPSASVVAEPTPAPTSAPVAPPAPPSAPDPSPSQSLPPARDPRSCPERGDRWRWPNGEERTILGERVVSPSCRWWALDQRWGPATGMFLEDLRYALVGTTYLGQLGADALARLPQPIRRAP